MGLPEDVEKHKEKGNDLYKAGEFYAAIGEFDKVLSRSGVGSLSDALAPNKSHQSSLSSSRSARPLFQAIQIKDAAVLRSNKAAVLTSLRRYPEASVYAR